jgi:hypothetical protein
MKISSLYLDRIDVEIRNVDIAGVQAFRRALARIGPAARMCDLVAATMRQGKGRVPAPDGVSLLLTKIVV